MLKRNPDAPIFACDDVDSGLAGTCKHCGTAPTAGGDYCGFECRLKASEAASAKRIAELEAKVEGLVLKEQMREGAERAAEEDARIERERMEAAQLVAEERHAENMEFLRRYLSEIENFSDDFVNCVPSRASLLVSQERVAQPTAETVTQPVPQSYDNREWPMWALGMFVVVFGVASIVGFA